MIELKLRQEFRGKRLQGTTVNFSTPAKIGWRRRWARSRGTGQDDSSEEAAAGTAARMEARPAK